MPTLPPTELSTWASKGGRNHDRGKPACERGRDKAGQIADHAATQCDNQRMAIGLETHQLVVQPRMPARAIWLFSPRQHCERRRRFRRPPSDF